MKRFYFFAMLLFILGGCAEEFTEPKQELSLGKGTYATVPAFELSTFDTSRKARTKVSINPNSLSFGWHEGDVIGVVPMDGTTMQSNYTVKDIQNDSTVCSFDGGAWTLKEGLSYCAYYPFTAAGEITSSSKVPLSFSGQYQQTNGSTSHLSEFLHMYASPVTNSDGTAVFQFNHLSSIVNFLFDVPSTPNFISLSVMAKDKIFAGGYVNLSDGTVTTSDDKDNELFVGLDEISPEEGDKLSVFIAMMPWDYELTDNNLNLTLTDDDGNEYYYTASFGKVEAGKGYQLMCKESSMTTTFDDPAYLRDAITKALKQYGGSSSTLKYIKIETECPDVGDYQANSNLTDEVPIYVSAENSSTVTIITAAQMIKLPKYCARLFADYSALLTDGLSDWTSDVIDASDVVSLESLFDGCSSLTTVDIEFLSRSTGEVTKTKNMFQNCEAMASVDMSALSGKMGKVTDMDDMFYGCSSLKSIDLTGWNTSSLTSCERMFYKCSSLTTIDLSDLDTKNVESLYYMMYGCEKVTDVFFSPEFIFPSKTTGIFTDLGSQSANKPDFYSTFHCTASQWNSISTILTSSYIDYYRWAGSGIIPDGKSLNAAIPADAVNISFVVSQTAASGEAEVFDNVYRSISGTTVIFRVESGKFLMGSADASGMFANKSHITGITGLDKIDWSGVTDLSELFWGCCDLQQILLDDCNIGNNVVTMSGMFTNCISLTSLKFKDTFSTAKVTGMANMFYGCKWLPIDLIESFDTSSLENAQYMFANTSFEGDIDLSHWNVRKVTTMQGMFQNSSFKNIETYSWMTTNLTDTYNMFNGCANLTTSYYRFSMSNVKDCRNMFKDCTALTSLAISNFNAWPEYMDNMFYGCTNLQSIDISHLNTKGASMTGVFKFCSAIRELTVGEYFSLDDVTSAADTFDDFGTAFKISDPDSKTAVSCPLKVWTDYLQPALSSKYGDWNDRFYCTSIAQLPTSTAFNTYAQNAAGGDLSNIKKLVFLNSSTEISSETRINWEFTGAHVYMSFDSGEGVLTVRSGGEKFFLDKESGRTNSSDSRGMFEGMVSMTAIEGLEDIVTDNAENMSYMFRSCKSLSSVNVGNFNTSNVTDMSYMFDFCSNVESIDVTGFDTSKVTDMGSMFRYCSSLKTLDVTGFDTSKVSGMSSMFFQCSKLGALDVSGFNTSNVEFFYNMFNACESIETLDLRGFSFARSIAFDNDYGYSTRRGMFNSCKSLKTLYLSSSFDPRYYEDGSWADVDDSRSNGTGIFYMMGTYNDKPYTAIHCTSSQWSVIRKCLSSESDYSFVEL